MITTQEAMALRDIVHEKVDDLNACLEEYAERGLIAKIDVISRTTGDGFVRSEVCVDCVLNLDKLWYADYAPPAEDDEAA